MIDVRKLVVMSHFDEFDCNKLSKLEADFKCETCMLKKMHRFFNSEFVRVNKRITRKNQRFHTDLVDDENIV